MKTLKAGKLLTEAKRAMANAYAPYSKYRVGAALLTAEGKIFHGCNVENASYGLTVCAERVAIQNAIAAGSKKFLAMAIVASGTKLPSPCGACRQVMAEFCTPDFTVFYASSANLRRIRHIRLSKLLPSAFQA